MSTAPIVLLSYANVNKTTTGGIRRINALLSALGQNVILCQPGEPHPAYESTILPVDLGKRRTGFNPAIFNYLIPSNRRAARKIIEVRRPGVVILTSIWATFALRPGNAIPVVLDSQNVDTVAMRERFGRYHPVTQLVKLQEGRIARGVARLLVCSAVDRDQFINLHGVNPDKIAIVPNGADVSEIVGSGEHQLPGDLKDKLADATVLLYAGSTNYQPNAAAVRFLSNRMMPELERMQVGRFKLILTGGGKKVADTHQAILNAGRLPDDAFKAVMARADICLAPTMSGSGTRLKILEYMAAGKAIVATPKGAEGIDCETDRHIVIAEPNRFVEEVIELAADGTKREQLGVAARELVRGKYDWDTCIKPLWRSVVLEITGQ